MSTLDLRFWILDLRFWIYDLRFTILDLRLKHTYLLRPCLARPHFNASALERSLGTLSIQKMSLNYLGLYGKSQPLELGAKFVQSANLGYEFEVFSPMSSDY